jgi:hypothetical protein
MPDPAGFAFTHSRRNSFQANNKNISPSSPPPAYNTVVGPTPLSYDQSCKGKNLPYPMDESWEYSHTPNDASVSKSRYNALSAFGINPFLKKEVKEQQIFAYGGTHIQELQGSTPSFMATNSAGPVDPFELLGSVPPQQATPARRNTDFHRGDPTQLLGKTMETLSFPAELPGHDPINHHPRSASIPQTRADRPYHGSYRRRPVPNTIAELPAGYEPGHQLTKIRSEGAHSDQEVASYINRRIQSQRNFRGLMDHLE